MKKNNKIILILIILILVIIGIFVFYINKNKKAIYLIFNDSGAFKYEDKEWATFDKEENAIFDDKFNIFINNENKGKYEIRYVNDKWYFFNEDRDSIDFSGDLFAYHSKENISLANIKKQELNNQDISYLNKVLKKENLEVNSLNGYRINEKVSLDIDGDDKEETIYAVSNADIMENNGKVFSCVYYVKNNKVYTLRLDVYDNNADEYYLYTINNLFKMENNGKYYLSITQFSDMTSENNGTYLYGLNMTNKYELLVSSNDKTKNKAKRSNNTILIFIIPVIIIIIGGYLFYKKVTAEEID